MRRILLKGACAMLLGVGLLVGVTACFPVNAIFTAVPFGGPPPLEVSFDASASSPAGAIRFYEWDFGDGTQGEGVIVEHTYTEPGEYWVELHCHSRDGSGFDDTAGFLVVCTEGPEVTFTAAPSAGDAPLRVWFDGRETTPLAISRRTLGLFRPGRERYVIDTLSWDYGDGSTVTWENDLTPQIFRINEPPSPLMGLHTYTVPGVYVVTLTVTDVFGLTGTAEREIVVGGEPEPDDDLVEEFTIANSFWEVADEEDDPEQECLIIWGELRNDGAVAAGCELTAVAYDAQDNPVGTAKDWPAAGANIASGATQPFSFLLCSLTVPPSDVERVEVAVSDTAVW